MRKAHRCEECNAVEIITYVCDSCEEKMGTSEFTLIDHYGDETHFCSFKCINKFAQDEINKENKKDTQSRYICGKGKKA